MHLRQEDQGSRKSSVRTATKEDLPGNDGNNWDKGSMLRISMPDGGGTSLHNCDAAGNGTSTVYAYKSGDPRYLIDSITHKRGTTVLATIAYPTRDAMGDPESMTDWTGTWTYDYDENSRLSLASPPVPVPDQPAGGVYGYDWVGNRLNPPADPNQMVYNKADELLTWPGMHTYSYYKDGSLSEEKDASGVTQRTYTYTDDGLLETATYPGGTAGFTWDADKNRVGMVMGGGTYSFVYDRTAGTPAVIEESGGASSVYYFREPGGSLLARLKGSDSRWYHFDELGSTRLLTDGNGVATDSYAYDAYGHLLSHTDPDPTDGMDMIADNPYQYVGRLGYYAHWQDAEFGLLELGVRFYEREAGRFTQTDSLRDGLDYYVYGYDDPTSLVDPLGTSACPWPGNSQICNDTKDQCVITFAGGSPEVLPPGKCTSSIWDHGDFGYFRGRWRKCPGRPWACKVRDGGEKGLVNPPHGWTPPHLSRKTCEDYCACQSKSKKALPFERKKADCVRRCLKGGPHYW